LEQQQSVGAKAIFCDEVEFNVNFFYGPEMFPVWSVSSASKSFCQSCLYALYNWKNLSNENEGKLEQLKLCMYHILI